MKDNTSSQVAQSTFLNRENGIVSRLVGLITKTTQKIENVPGKHLETIACVIYVIAHLLMAIVHEPWYDEAVAWNIARSASIKEILFTIPHYEGHPPLWHLILLPFAKLGAPYELSLSLVSLIFAGTACCLIIWKAPFPRIVRLLLPFTYFFFYQYGVVSRPYCVMMLTFVLLAMVYHKRNEKPLRYVLSLMLLCLTSAYGIVIAGGLAIVWVFEIWSFQNIIAFIKNIFKDNRFWCLLILLGFALMLICEIMPREDTFATVLMDKEKSNGFLTCLCYMLFAGPLEVSLSSIYVGDGLLKFVELFPPLLIATCGLGVLFWIMAILWGSTKKTTLVLIVPYVLYSIFAAIVYVSRHHIGIGLLFLVFWFWISRETKSDKSFTDRFSTSTKISIENVLVLFGSLALIVSLCWNVSSCIQDTFYSYATGRDEAKFIKKYNLDEYRMMAGWKVDRDGMGNVIDMDINYCRYVDNVAPYFDHNVFFNFNGGSDDVNYTTHRVASEEYTNVCIEEWKQQLPDVCYMMDDELELVYEDVNWSTEYTLVYEKTNNMVWKGVPVYDKVKIYIRTDLLETIGLAPKY